MDEDDDDFDEVDALEKMAPEEFARRDGDSRGWEFRRKEIAYDRRGGRHEFTEPKIACYRLMLRLANHIHMVQLAAPEPILEKGEQRIAEVIPYLTPQTIVLLGKYWPRFIADYNIGGLLTILQKGWAEEFLGRDESEMH
jgi:hypothetical protein